MSTETKQILAERVQRIKPSPTLAISAKANELKASGKSIVNMSTGEPDFDTPAHIKEAAIKAIHEGKTKYTAVDGIPSLKQAIINKLKNDNHLNYQANQILVSSGAKQSIYNVLAAVIQAGDEVIIPSPYWVSYPAMVELCDGTPVIIETGAKQQFKLTAEQLKASITEKTRALFLNSPSNPSGATYSSDELKALADVLKNHPNILIISDDIYEHIMWNNTPFNNILNACPELHEQCVVINGVSKAYAMTGWRIGYAAGPVKLIAAMKKVQSQSTSNPCSISQHAAEAALTGDQECIREMTKIFKERHDYIVAALNDIEGIHCLPADGAFYSFPSVEGLLNNSSGISDDIAFADFLLDKAGVAVVPGTAFGAPGYIRLSYATSMENIKEAIKRIKVAVTANLAA